MKLCEGEKRGLCDRRAGRSRWRLGMVDALEEAGIPAFGPKKNAAVIEGSKAFCQGSDEEIRHPHGRTMRSLPTRKRRLPI